MAKKECEMRRIARALLNGSRIVSKHDKESAHRYRALCYARWLAARDGITVPASDLHVIWEREGRFIRKVIFEDGTCIEIPHYNWTPRLWITQRFARSTFQAEIWADDNGGFAKRCIAMILKHAKSKKEKERWKLKLAA